MLLEQKHLASALSLSLTVLQKQWNSVPSDICHIQSSHGFKTALKKTHPELQIILQVQMYNKWFQILSSFCPPPPPPFLPPLPPSFPITFPQYVCVCKEYDMFTYYLGGFMYYIYIHSIHFSWSCKAQSAHPCWWNIVLYKWPLLLVLVLVVASHLIDTMLFSVTDVSI